MTWMLEKCFGWTGVLIEAHPDMCKRLDAADRTAHKVCAAVCPAGHQVTMPSMNVSAASGVLGVLEYATKQYMQTWKGHFDTVNTIKVPCRPMTSVLEEAGIPEVEYISIDTQGAEEVVLKTSNLSAFTGVVLVEAESTAAAKNVRVRHMLLDAGFVQIPHILQPQRTRGGAGYNELYVRPSLVQPAWNGTSFGDRKFPILYAGTHTEGRPAAPTDARERRATHALTSSLGAFDRRSRTARLIDGLMAVDEMVRYVEAG